MKHRTMKNQPRSKDFKEFEKIVIKYFPNASWNESTLKWEAKTKINPKDSWDQPEDLAKFDAEASKKFYSKMTGNSWDNEGNVTIGLRSIFEDYVLSYSDFLNEKKPAGAPDWHDSDAPDAEGRFRDLESVNEGRVGQYIVDLLRKIAKNQKMRTWTNENFPDFPFEKYITMLAELEYNRAVVELFQEWSKVADLAEIEKAEYETLRGSQKAVEKLESKILGMGTVPAELDTFFKIATLTLALTAKEYLVHMANFFQRKGSNLEWSRGLKLDDLEKTIGNDRKTLESQLDAEINKLLNSPHPTGKPDTETSDLDLIDAFSNSVGRRANNGKATPEETVRLAAMKLGITINLGGREAFTGSYERITTVLKVENWSPFSGKISTGDSIIEMNGIRIAAPEEKRDSYGTLMVGRTMWGSYALLTLTKLFSALEPGDTVKLRIGTPESLEQDFTTFKKEYTVSATYQPKTNWFASGDKNAIVKFVRASRY